MRTEAYRVGNGNPLVTGRVLTGVPVIGVDALVRTK